MTKTILLTFSLFMFLKFLLPVVLPLLLGKTRYAALCTYISNLGPKSKKSILYRTWSGIQRGHTVPNLPPHILSFNNILIVKIIRVLGGISTLLLVSWSVSNFFTGIYYLPALYICILLSTIHALYSIYLAVVRTKYIRKQIKNEAYMIRNSPLDKWASKLANAWACAKGVCENVAPVAFVVGATTGIDQARVAAGADPIVLPTIGEYLVPETEQTKHMKQLAIDQAEFQRLAKEMNQLEEQRKLVDVQEKDGLIDKQFGDTWKKKIENNESLIKERRDLIKSNIVDRVEALNNKAKLNVLNDKINQAKS